MTQHIQKYAFISYSHQDRLQVESILPLFKQEHIYYWYDHLLAPGVKWSPRILKMLNQSNMFVLFVSRNSLASDNVFLEFQAAQKLNIPSRQYKIITLILEDISQPDFWIQCVPQLTYTTSEDLNDKKKRTQHFLQEVLELQYIQQVKLKPINQNYIQFREAFQKAFAGLVGTELVDYTGLVPVYNKNKIAVGISTRRHLHELPIYHKTVIIIVVPEIDTTSEKSDENGLSMEERPIILQIKPKKSEFKGRSLAFFGGHSEIDESYWETAIRELSEELNIPRMELNVEENLHRIGEEGQFNYEHYDDSEKYYNYEFSTLYVYHLSKDLLPSFQETIGNQIIFLETIQCTLDFLLNLQKKQPISVDKFATIFQEPFEISPRTIIEMKEIYHRKICKQKNERFLFHELIPDAPLMFSDDITRVYDKIQEKAELRKEILEKMELGFK